MLLWDICQSYVCNSQCSFLCGAAYVTEAREYTRKPGVCGVLLILNINHEPFVAITRMKRTFLFIISFYMLSAGVRMNPNADAGTALNEQKTLYLE